MRRIVNGKLYDTGPAELLAKWTNGCSYRDVRRVAEQLYRTPSGDYLLYGEGGHMSPYAVRVTRSAWSSGARIVPMTRDEAADWAEDRLGHEICAGLFPRA